MSKKAIIGLALLMLLLTAGAAASFFMGRSLDTPSGPVDEVISVGEVGYVRLPPISLPMMRRGRVNKYLTLAPSLVVPAGTNVSEVRRRIPRLRDAFVREVNGRSVMRDDGSGFADIEGLKKRLLRQARRVLGEHSINEVLLNNQTGQVPRK